MRSDEHQQQAALFDWADFMRKKIPELEALYAVPNGGLRNKATAAMLKAEGVRAGELDVNLDVPSRGFHGLRIEMKTQTGTLSPAQRRASKRHVGYGYFVAVCRSWEEARDVILWYLGRTGN